MTDQPELETSPPVVAESPGERLRRARAAAGLSTQDVATRLRLGVDTIEALEQDRYDQLPAQIFVRGYLRNYSVLLGLPADELLDSYAHRTEAEPASGLKPKRVGRQAGYGDRTMRYVTTAIVLVMLGLVVVWWYNHERFGAHPPAPTAQQASAPGAAHSPPAAAEPSKPAAVRPQASAGASATPAATEQAAGGGETANQPPAQSGASTAAVAAAPAATPPAPKAEAPAAASPPTAGSDRLTLRFDGTSWLEVHDATGKRLAYELGQKGDVVTLHGKGPFTVLLGNSPVVEVQYNGEPFDQSPYNTHGKTARFKVGQ